MRLATSDTLIREQGLSPPISLRTALDRGIRPAVGFSHPSDVLKDPDLTLDEKREILSSWASDASAVQDEPGWRWLLGTVEPVPLADVREALLRLDCRRSHRLPRSRGAAGWPARPSATGKATGPRR